MADIEDNECGLPRAALKLGTLQLLRTEWKWLGMSSNCTPLTHTEEVGIGGME